ncbi:MAG: 3-carboxyethylcatechol 2,3-dioxygenase [Pseudolabrys sp.]|nr:3-carboxyethylcatechol 2,3-dioxygenase [Pseudolabrys sp.]MCW5684158.1 3-carboxyethylcatechol 2,3-dioxygenase [Pseudolabrys sp.]
MAVQLICCSHSPLMTTDVEETQPETHASFFRELDACARELHAFNPDLVVIFGPDHFNGFFYELMPAFCIGTAAVGSKDWHLESGPLRVPRELALSCIRFLQNKDFDLALSHDMRVDHGMTIPLYKLTGALSRYNVLPVFINCAADPRPSFRRARKFGEAIGEFLAGTNLRLTLIGSGGLSHDPPTPRLEMSPPDVAQRLIKRHIPSQDELDARENRVVRAARDMVVGKGPCLPPSEQWDRDFLDKFVSGKPDVFDTMSDAEIDRIAGFGAHEVRTWVAAAAAARKIGEIQSTVKYYHLVPEWITGMGIVTAQA